MSWHPMFFMVLCMTFMFSYTTINDSAWIQCFFWRSTREVVCWPKLFTSLPLVDVPSLLLALFTPNSKTLNVYFEKRSRSSTFISPKWLEKCYFSLSMEFMRCVICLASWRKLSQLGLPVLCLRKKNISTSVSENFVFIASKCFHEKLEIIPKFVSGEYTKNLGPFWAALVPWKTLLLL